MTLHYPPDSTVREFGLLNIALSVPAEFGGRIIVSVNGLEQKEVKNERSVKCFSVRIEPGINEISVAAWDGEHEVERRTFRVFRRSDLVRKFREPPEEFKKILFHEDTWSECAACHTMEPTDADKKSFNIRTLPDETGARSASTCYSCHQAMTSYPYVHGPVAVWACLRCHDPEASPCYAVRETGARNCYTCHVEQRKAWMSRKYIHGPVNLGRCSICHNPHASGQPFLLISHTWDLCVTCHVEKGSGRHVIADVFSKEGHPTRDRPDPLRPGRELTCASCHNPHASEFPKLWPFEVENAYELCQKCHEK